MVFQNKTTQTVTTLELENHIAKKIKHLTW